MKQVGLPASVPASVGKGWGAFFYPPIFVGTPLDREALNRQNDGCRAFVKALDTPYKGRQVIVSREGLVVLAEADRATAVALLNEVMAVLLFGSVPVCGIRDMDLVQCSIGMANKEINSGRWCYETGNPALLERGFEFRGLDATRFYHPDNIKSFIRRAEVMTSHPATRTDLRLLLEAYTRHQESAFAASFLLSWLGIDRLLQARWRRQTKQRPDDDAVESSTSDPGWNAGKVIEDLHCCNAVDPGTYHEAKRLREKHSSIVKSDWEPTSGESESCFYFFLSQLRKTLASAEL